MNLDYRFPGVSRAAMEQAGISTADWTDSEIQRLRRGVGDCFDAVGEGVEAITEGRLPEAAIFGLFDRLDARIAEAADGRQPGELRRVGSLAGLTSYARTLRNDVADRLGLDLEPL